MKMAKTRLASKALSKWELKNIQIAEIIRKFCPLKIEILHKFCLQHLKSNVNVISKSGSKSTQLSPSCQSHSLTVMESTNANRSDFRVFTFTCAASIAFYLF